jgi:hypothetical protein
LDASKANHFSINWCKDSDPIGGDTSIPILILTSLKENLGAIEFTLSKEHMERLDSVSATQPPFPYQFLQKYGIPYIDGAGNVTRVGDRPRLWNNMF